MRALSVDPGISNLAFALVEWNGKNCKDERNFSFPWVCHVNLTTTTTTTTGIRRRRNGDDDDLDHYDDENVGNGDDDYDDEGKREKEKETIRYEKKTRQMAVLTDFLDTNPTIKTISEMKDVDVWIEEQEGARDANVLFSLMRVNFFLGFLCRYFASFGKKITFVPKTYKYGWSFVTRIARKKCEIALSSVEPINKTKRKTKTESAIDVVRSKGTTKKKRMPRNAKVSKAVKTKPFDSAAMVKNNRKKAICAMIRNVAENGDSSKEIKTFCRNCADGVFNHVADAASAGIRAIVEKHFLRTLGKCPKDEPSKRLKQQVENDFLCGRTVSRLAF